VSIIVGLAFVVWASLYGVSGPYAAHQLRLALLSATNHPSHPLLPSLVQQLATLPSRPPAWQGVGQQYLRHVWPQITQQDQPLALLRLIARQPQQAQRVGYRRGFQQYILNVGAVNQSIWIVLQRDGVWTWQVQAVCSPRSQPTLELNRCPSDSR
jgi:hypothetical protein